MGIGNFNVKYDPIKVYRDYEESKPEDEKLPSPLISLPFPSAATPLPKLTPALWKSILCVQP